MSQADVTMTMGSDPGLYGYLPYSQRPKITWPNGAKIAVWIAPNIEFYEYAPPTNPQRTPWPRPLPDVLSYSHRDYGNRAGWQRMLKAMDAVGMRGSVSLNVALCEHHPEIIKACADHGWEFFSHGIYNTRYTYGMTPDQEREIIRDSIETIRKHTGQRMDGWLAPALSNNTWTMDLLAEAGVLYTCDLFHDDQPTPINVKSGRLISVPYSLEMNDTIVYNTNLYTPRHYGTAIKRQFDQLYAEGAESGTVMCIPLHPYLVGQPHRIDAFAEALQHIAGHDGVWLATGREIAQHYLDNHYDAMAQAIAAANR
ncbi:polysaccharide deacetylase family protein [Verticiella alkaliphila]|uniref:polysaccharide deacetylase family protein n=1 Tax=Verticiella alkaliphila TaxID=2779529 RepID=UPI00209B6FC4|nr:polysaccharide deacetylase family protein [Verticiella sp. GG226]